MAEKKLFKIKTDNLNAQLRERLQHAQKENNEVDTEFYGAVLWKMENLEKEVDALKEENIQRGYDRNLQE